MDDKFNTIINRVAFVVGVLFLVASIVNGQYVNKNKIEETKSIITTQAEIEADFEIKGYTADKPNVILNPYGNSPLTALVIFNTEEEVSPSITVKGKDEHTTYERSFLYATKHYVPVYGLYPDADNEVILTVGGVETELIIRTGKLPDDLAIPTNVISNKDKLSDELYFFTPSSAGYTSAYDVNGDVRWYLTEKMVWDIERLHNGKLLLSTERPINPPYFTTGLYEMNLLGKVYNEYSLPGGYHHDYFELDSKNLLVASNDFGNFDGTVEDVIVELDRDTGEVVKTWDLKDVLNMEDGKSESWSAYDWFHNNSVWYNDKENEIILSGRHKDAVISIDYDSGELNWIIGDPTNWSEDYQKYFFTPIGDDEFEWQWSQHAAMVTPEGYIFVLDNGNNKSKNVDEYVSAQDSYTRGVMYDINREDMTITQVWEYGKSRGSEFYSPYISDVDYIDEDHYLVHSGGIVYIDGVNSNRPAGFDKGAEHVSTTVELIDDEVVFEITLPTNMYRAEKMSLYNFSDFIIGEAGRLGSLGETKITNERYGILSEAVEIDDEYEAHDITWTNEEDRLVLNGTFDKGTPVSIVLYANFKIKEYSVPISNKPYTALCIDIFQTEETEGTLEINKYINKEGLKGNQSVYIKIGDKLYNTGKFVKFSR